MNLNNEMMNNNKFRSSSPNKTHSKLRNTYTDSENISSYETLNTLRSNQFILGNTNNTSNLRTNLKNINQIDNFTNYIQHTDQTNLNIDKSHPKNNEYNKKYDINVIDSYSFNNQFNFNQNLNESESENDFRDLRSKIKSMENNMEK